MLFFEQRRTHLGDSRHLGSRRPRLLRSQCIANFCTIKNHLDRSVRNWIEIEVDVHLPCEQSDASGVLIIISIYPRQLGSITHGAVKRSAIEKMPPQPPGKDLAYRALA